MEFSDFRCDHQFRSYSLLNSVSFPTVQCCYLIASPCTKGDPFEAYVIPTSEPILTIIRRKYVRMSRCFQYLDLSISSPFGSRSKRYKCSGSISESKYKIRFFAFQYFFFEQSYTIKKNLSRLIRNNQDLFFLFNFYTCITERRL